MAISRALNRTGVVLALAAVAALAVSHARADEHRRTDKSVSIWARAFFANVDTEVRVDSQTLGLAGTLLDFETDLGIDESPTLPIIGIQWWFAKRHALDLAYFELSRDGLRDIDFEISWDDLVFPVDFDISSFIDTKTTRLAYRYALVSNQRSMFSIGGGIHFTDVEVGIREPNIGSSEVTSNTPMPMVTVAFDYDLSPKWTVRLLGEWFGIEAGDVKGEILHGDATLQWHTFEHVSLELGYNLFSLDFGEGDADFRGLLNYTYKGPFLGASVVF